MGKPALLYTAVIFLQFLAVFCSGKTPPNLSTDEEALLAFKSRITADPLKILANNWSTSTTTSSICSWYGVTCGASRRVTALSLYNLSLEGTVAQHLGNLSFLSSLDLGLNKFTGLLPRELSNLHRLQQLHLDFNAFTSHVPQWLPALANLQLLSLRNNSFTGSIPNLFNLSKLDRLVMSYNLIEGYIPKTIGNLSALRFLDLKFNQLTGSIPYSLFNISSLEVLDLTSNGFSGRIPTNICDNFPNIEMLLLSVNQLSGSIPSNLQKCKTLQRLSLSINQLNGTIPREIGTLPMLKDLYLGANTFQGGIPLEIGNLSRLEIFSMQRSSMNGTIPSFIFNMSSLKYIDLGRNGLTGSLPRKVNLPNLEQIFLNANRLTGEGLSSLLDCENVWLLQLSENRLTGAIPKKIGNLTQLKILFLNENRMSGEIPSELGNLNLMQQLGLAYNGFSGSIPASIFNISTMVELNLDSNSLSGKLPPNMGSSLVNLELLYLGSNTLTGSLPSSINNASKLSIIQMGSNSFSGTVPEFGNLKLLKMILLPNNSLRGESPNLELRFLSSLQNCRYLERVEVSLNPLQGILPLSLGNLSTSLKLFKASGCSIRGSIPVGFGNLSSLASIDLESNELTGFIPEDIGRLQKLEVVYLEYNKLEGKIPTDLCKISRLGDLYLSGNNLTGAIPSCLGQMKLLRRVFLDSNRLSSALPNLWDLVDVWSLNLSNNMLSGKIPSQIKNLKVLRDLDLSWNKFSGEIPSSIGQTPSLERLSFSHNSLRGTIPSSMGSLRGLVSLNLSNNKLEGLIPKSLEELRALKLFDVSSNRLEGEIPSRGVFVNFSAQSFLQNQALCGVSRFQVPPCKAQKVRRSRHVLLIIYVAVPILSVVIAVGFSLWMIQRRKDKRRQNHEFSTLSSWRRVSYQELMQATQDFNEVNLIGRGSFGSVYRGALFDGLNIAVKVFNTHLDTSIRSFDVECEVMSNVRHRNLIQVISCCSNQDFKALVLEYMPNGSLEKWLYSENHPFNLQQILNIAIDVAVALEYLHHGNIYPIIHCDLKPSNILLDEDMTAHVSDFGISKLFDQGEAIRHTITLATVGYMAPEYGSEGKVSTNGDVYSFGILVLEMLTRKRPTEDMFDGEMSLKEWVSGAMQENVEAEVVATGLLTREEQYFSAKKECISSVLRLAMVCLASSAGERSNMIEVAASLRKIREHFLASMRRHQQGVRTRIHQEVNRN